MNTKVSVKVYVYGIKYNLFGEIKRTDGEIYTVECLPEQVFYTAKAVALLPDFAKYDRVELRWEFQGKRYMYHYNKVSGKTDETYQENTPHQWV